METESRGRGEGGEGPGRGGERPRRPGMRGHGQWPAPARLKREAATDSEGKAVWRGMGLRRHRGRSLQRRRVRMVSRSRDRGVALRLCDAVCRTVCGWAPRRRRRAKRCDERP
jgi:hypothetical protein